MVGYARSDPCLHLASPAMSLADGRPKVIDRRRDVMSSDPLNRTSPTRAANTGSHRPLHMLAGLLPLLCGVEHRIPWPELCRRANGGGHQNDGGGGGRGDGYDVRQGVRYCLLIQVLVRAELQVLVSLSQCVERRSSRAEEPQHLAVR